VEIAISDYKEDIAAIIIEPIPANNGLILQDKEYLQFLRDITKKNDILLIFDEVISGFRVGFEGAAGYYGIQPDIITYGKIIGGGMPVGAYGASKEIMSHISPDGNVYQAGTLSGNPVAMNAGIAQLKICLQPDFYKNLNSKTEKFVQSINDFASKNNYLFKIFRIGSIFWFAFTDKEFVRTSTDIESESMKYFREMHSDLLESGVYLGPSGYEVGFVSSAHSEEILDAAAKKICNSLTKIFTTSTERVS